MQRGAFARNDPFADVKVLNLCLSIAILCIRLGCLTPLILHTPVKTSSIIGSPRPATSLRPLSKVWSRIRWRHRREPIVNVAHTWQLAQSTASLKSCQMVEIQWSVASAWTPPRETRDTTAATTAMRFMMTEDYPADFQGCSRSAQWKTKRIADGCQPTRRMSYIRTTEDPCT